MDTRDEAVSVEEKTLVRWHLAKRVAFRFAFAYFILFSFPGLYEPHSELISQVAPNLIPGVAARALHLPIPTGVYTRDEALSDSIFGTSRTLLLLAIAFAVTAIWSVLDRKRLHYQRLFDWLTLYLRMFVGVSVLGYGAAKLVPTQMRDPTLITLMAPFGNLSPTSLLWSFMGSSKPYTIFAGTVETLGALLMFVPRATTLASLICAVALANVFVLDLSYDVGVKQFSLHLLLMSFFLLAPDAGRLTDALLFHRGTRPASFRPLFATAWLNLAALALQLVFGGYHAIYEIRSNYRFFRTFASVPTTTPFYGVWNVQEFILDGESRPPLTTDVLRWQRIVFDRSVFNDDPDIEIQFANGVARLTSGEFDLERRSMTLKKAFKWTWEWSHGLPPPPPFGRFSVETPQVDRLVLDGEMEGRHIHATLARAPTEFPLRKHGFRWIVDKPDFGEGVLL